ncbi:chloride channel protein [Synechocystis sp. CACIAM 05]|uniref:chloride channel protein n=1 Tax=Synechocystis sp. CACIAM 05 TaxID=1933929 RepID=UPI001F02A163|nr:chloride channel protein [Synechocystis sp. CACIAM 05]
MSTWTVGGLLGGLIGSLAAVMLTESIKQTLSVISGLDPIWLLLIPLFGVALAVLVLFGLGKGQPVQTVAPREVNAPGRWGSLLSWYSFPHDIARADLTGDVVNASGVEERFPWNLAPLRAIAILSTVGFGAPMGTESPAAHIGFATGTWLGSVNSALRPLVRPLAIGGGAASVSALMGIPLVGSFFMFELSGRRQIPLTPERGAAMLAGGLVGWGINVAFNLQLIRLVVPKVPPADLWNAMGATLFIGVVTGTITALTGEAIYWARGLRTKPAIRLLAGSLAMLLLAVAIARIATPAAAFGPGGAAIVWAENIETTPYHLLAVAILRAASTTAAVLAGGCGGVFVPFLAIGDLTGRVFATIFGISGDLAGAAGAAAGIAGGYRLPLTAVAMVLGVGGPETAQITCLGTVVIAAFSGLLAARLANQVSSTIRTIGRQKSRLGNGD